MLYPSVPVLAASTQRDGAVVGANLSEEPVLYDEVRSWSSRALQLDAS
ncbi:hypothetical protein BB170200_02929 [Mycobacterium marinum]|nr:hypothetical protein BB170200_02929 [Mycobacterium marinum]